MERDPGVWAVLGRAIRSDRDRQGLTREQLAERVIERGGKITARSIASLEYGTVPKKRDKPPTLEPTVSALGWPRGSADRILNGEDPADVLEGRNATEPPRAPARDDALELLPRVYEFSRTVVALGGDPELRDEFDAIAQRLIDSVPPKLRADRALYGLAAYRPQAEGEGPAPDDTLRMLQAMERES